jgi:hypothetical protein
MKILNTEDYINEKLNIQPIKDVGNVFRKEPNVDEKTRRFILDHNLVWNRITCRYDSKYDVNISRLGLESFPIKFGKIGGDFICMNNKLTSLKGAPIEVYGDFICDKNKLKTLEYAPKIVGSSFMCLENELESLEGAPQEIGYVFDCSENMLKNLKGAPRKVGGNFICDNNNLESLDGAPELVGGDFHCKDNYSRLGVKFVMPKNIPSWIVGDIIE